MTGALRRDREPESDLDRAWKRENNDLYNRVAELIEINESHQKLNGKLQERLTELEEENKKLHTHVDKQVNGCSKVRNVMRVKDLQEFLAKFTEADSQRYSSRQCYF